MRLSWKTVTRLKSVCKRWLSLVSSDHFCHRQRLFHRPKPPPSLIVQHSDRDIAGTFYWNPTSTNGATTPYTFSTSLPPEHHYKILQSCNGLWLLVGDHDPDFRAGGYSRRMYRVYNPTTGQSTRIKPRYKSDEHYIQAIGLAFDPSESPYYKVVCIFFMPPQPMYALERYHINQVEVYDSESRSWKIVLAPLSPAQYGLYWCGYSREAQYWNNTIFWWRPDERYFYCFDIAKNEVKSFGFPRNMGRRDWHIQELDGTLYCYKVRYVWAKRMLSMKVWEWGGGGRWKLKKNYEGISSRSIGRCVRLMHDDSDGSLQLIYHHTMEMKMRAYNFLHRSSRVLLHSMPPPFHESYDHQDYDKIRDFQFEETLTLV